VNPESYFFFAAFFAGFFLAAFFAVFFAAFFAVDFFAAAVLILLLVAVAIVVSPNDRLRSIGHLQRYQRRNHCVRGESRLC